MTLQRPTLPSKLAVRRPFWREASEETTHLYNAALRFPLQDIKRTAAEFDAAFTKLSTNEVQFAGFCALMRTTLLVTAVVGEIMLPKTQEYRLLLAADPAADEELFTKLRFDTDGRQKIQILKDNSKLFACAATWHGYVHSRTAEAIRQKSLDSTFFNAVWFDAQMDINATQPFNGGMMSYDFPVSPSPINY